MFQQEINLYHAFEEPAPEASLLSWRALLLSNIFILIIFTMIALFSQISIQRLKNERNSLQAKATELKNAFETRSRDSKLLLTPDLTLSLRKLTDEMLAQEQILRKIANRSLFSNNMEALGHLITPGVWLTNITLSESGDKLTLKGKSLSSVLLQSFFTRLTSDKLFHDFAFSVKNIESDASAANKTNLIFDIALIRGKS